MTLEVDPGVDPSAAAKEVNRDSSNQPGGGPWRPAVGVGGWVKSTLSRRLKKAAGVAMDMDHAAVITTVVKAQELLPRTHRMLSKGLHLALLRRNLSATKLQMAVSEEL